MIRAVKAAIYSFAKVQASRNASKIYTANGQDAFDVHQLAALMQSSYEQALVQSLRWELEGHIRREPNGRYVLKPL
jgi:predicted Rossmann fold nucleotide-binding protein DprA/Smf involved in DNA uptake